jgi:hypothetical protein
MSQCQCGATFEKRTNQRWCSRQCPTLKRKRYQSSHNWYLRNKAKPYDPNGVCLCGEDFERRYGGREQQYCSAACRQKYTALKWRTVNKQRRHEINRKSRLKRHNLCHADYLVMLDQQGGCCKICGSTDPGSTQGRKRRYLCVDHCHATGRVRGLLCSKCNTGLGSFGDDTARLQAAIEYLRGSSI